MQSNGNKTVTESLVIRIFYQYVNFFKSLDKVADKLLLVFLTIGLPYFIFSGKLFQFFKGILTFGNEGLDHMVFTFNLLYFLLIIIGIGRFIAILNTGENKIKTVTSKALLVNHQCLDTITVPNYILLPEKVVIDKTTDIYTHNSQFDFNIPRSPEDTLKIMESLENLSQEEIYHKPISHITEPDPEPEVITLTEEEFLERKMRRDVLSKDDLNQNFNL